jgi:hypothetical protein
VAIVKQSMSWLWGIGGLVALVIVLFAAISVYKRMRNKK